MQPATFSVAQLRCACRESTWDNPLDQHFRQEVERWRDADFKKRAREQEAKARKELARQNRERARARIRARSVGACVPPIVRATANGVHANVGVGMAFATSRKGWPPKTPQNPVSSAEKISHARKSMRRLVVGLGMSSRTLSKMAQDRANAGASAAAGAGGGGVGTGPRATEHQPEPKFNWQDPHYSLAQLRVLAQELGLSESCTWQRFVWCGVSCVVGIPGVKDHPALLANIRRYVDLSSPAQELPDGWTQYKDADGVVYYHEAATGDTTYLHPVSRLIRQQMVQVRQFPNSHRGLLSDRVRRITDLALVAAWRW